MVTGEIQVNPDVLTWARDTAGLSILTVEEKLKLKPGTVYSLEHSQQAPRPILEKLAHLYKRPFFALLLPEPPETQKVYCPT